MFQSCNKRGIWLTTTGLLMIALSSLVRGDCRHRLEQSRTNARQVLGRHSRSLVMSSVSWNINVPFPEDFIATAAVFSSLSQETRFSTVVIEPHVGKRDCVLEKFSRDCR
uniref:Secreted protein n=1 Tax=Panagrellus redivivus TaxID=6233 RepID=A0A7E4VZB7_PANRE